MSRSKSKQDSSDESTGNEPFRHLEPKDQPNSVHEFSEPLYGAFVSGSAEHMRFRISGCRIDPVPFVQTDSGEYLTLGGQVVSPDHAKSLGLDDLDELEETPAPWNQAGKRESYLSELDSLSKSTKLAEAVDGRQWIVWCNHVHGNLTAWSGESSVDIPFSFWGARLVAGLDSVPPYSCPLTGVESWRLDIDDAGTITDVDQILRCEESGRRLIATSMATCSSIDRLVDRSLLAACPTDGKLFLKRLSESCHFCFQAVRPESLKRNKCASCQGLKKFGGSDFLKDSDLRQIMESQPWISQVTKCKITHQYESWLLQFAYEQSTWRMVIQNSGQVTQVAKSHGWLRNWSNIPRLAWPAFIAQTEFLPDANDAEAEEKSTPQ